MDETTGQYMWGYQHLYMPHVKYAVERAFKILGKKIEAACFLVGVLRPGAIGDRICLDPNDGSIPFGSDLFDEISRIYAQHPRHNIFYTDPVTTQEQPDMIRRQAIVEAIEARLEQVDPLLDVVSFVGRPEIVGNYHVVPIVQLPTVAFDELHTLDSQPMLDQYKGAKSIFHAVVETILKEATRELDRTHPGRELGAFRSGEEALRDAANSFMYSPGMMIGSRHPHHGLFGLLNDVAATDYERQAGFGRIIFCAPDHQGIDVLVQFNDPVPLRQARWARKIMQMTSREVGALSDGKQLLALVRLSSSFDAKLENLFVVDFFGHYMWQLSCGQKTLLRSEYGEARLPTLQITAERFSENLKQQFPLATSDGADQLWTVVSEMLNQPRGSMLVVVENAREEATRLRSQGTLVSPIKINKELVTNFTSIDGTIIIDPDGTCYSVGVILDGPAVESCTPSRGSRYNSAIRYVTADPDRRMAFVISDDRTLDVIPLHRPRVLRSRVESHVQMLEDSTVENYHGPRNWVRDHYLYLTQSQCDRVNMKLSALKTEVLSRREIWLNCGPFSEAPDLHARHFLDE